MSLSPEYIAESIAAGCPPVGDAIAARDTRPPWRAAAELAARAAKSLSPLRTEERHAADALYACVDALDAAAPFTGEPDARPAADVLVAALSALEDALRQLADFDRPHVAHRALQAWRLLQPVAAAAVAEQTEERRRACAAAVAAGTAEGESQFAAIAAALEADEGAERGRVA